MKSMMTFIGVLIVLAAIAAVFYGGYLAIGYVWQLFVELESTLRLMLFSSFTVFLIGCFILADAIKSAARMKLKGQLTEAKIHLYQTMADLYEQYFSGSQSGPMGSQKDILARLDGVNSELCVIAGSCVIEANRKLEAAISNREGNDKLHALYQQLIRKIRQDLGHGTNIEESRLRFLVVREPAGRSDSAGLTAANP